MLEQNLSNFTSTPPLNFYAFFWLWLTSISRCTPISFISISLVLPDGFTRALARVVVPPLAPTVSCSRLLCVAVSTSLVGESCSRSNHEFWCAPYRGLELRMLLFELKVSGVVEKGRSESSREYLFGMSTTRSGLSVTRQAQMMPTLTSTIDQVIGATKYPVDVSKILVGLLRQLAYRICLSSTGSGVVGKPLDG